MTNTLRGEFDATIGGEFCAFDTTPRHDRAHRGGLRRALDHGDRRRRRDRAAGPPTRSPLLAAALARGRGTRRPQALAARATVAEAEAFILALMGALGFTAGAARGGGGTDQSPLDGSSDGDAGANSRSAA